MQGNSICSCCKCNCNSIKIHRKAALILMHVRIRISSGDPRPSSFVIMEAAAWPQANRTAKMVSSVRGEKGDGGGIRHDFWYCVSIKIFIRSLEFKLMRAAYANLCGCLSNHSLFYSCPCAVPSSALLVPLCCPCWTRHGMSFGSDRFYLMTWH